MPGYLSCFGHLDHTQSERLRGIAAKLQQRKHIVGAAGFEPDSRIRCLVSQIVALPILELGLDWYRGWHEIVIYPGAFRQRYEYEDEAGVVHSTHRELAGEAWSYGPLILSWDDIEADLESPEEGRNVVIHECAHKLDLLRGGDANGFPPLHREMDSHAWTREFTMAYEKLCACLEHSEETPVDPYAAESPGEFFAVVSEHFFMSPSLISGTHPNIYQQLRAFYRQDPLNKP